jgi:hypothetical protein
MRYLTCNEIQVGAIVVYEQAALEAQMELEDLSYRPATNIAGALNEEVFLAQLHRRALLLNNRFQDAVKEIVVCHAVDAESACFEPEPLGFDAHVSPATATGVFGEYSVRPTTSSSSIVRPPSAQALDESTSGYGDVRAWWSRRASATLVHESPGRMATAADSRTSSTAGSVIQGTRLGRRLKGSSEVFPQRCSSASTESGNHGTHVMCAFRGGSAMVEVLTAPVKTLARMREKVLEYSAEAAASIPGCQPGWVWPQTARIVDPVRTSIVCNGPAQILEAFRWFCEGGNGRSGVPICRVKNRFSFDKGEILGG